MAQTSDKTAARTLLPDGVILFLRQRILQGFGLFLGAVGIAFALALVSYAPSDPSFNSATLGPVRNWMGAPGASSADLALQALGLGSALLTVILLSWAWCLLRYQRISALWLRFSVLAATLIVLAMALSVVRTPTSWPLATGLGGVVGSVLLDRLVAVLQGWGAPPGWINTMTLGIFCFLPAPLGAAFAMALPRSDWRAIAGGLALTNSALGRATLWLFAHAHALPRRLMAPHDANAAPIVADRRKPRREKRKATAHAPSKDSLVAPKSPRAKAGRKAAQQRQRSLDLIPGETYALPPLDLLDNPEPSSDGGTLNADALAQNAAMLASVLEDFGVKGEIVKVRPGPVVTLYELEPAPGTKTSRVIGLSDDIARSMSAISVRVAVIPGRNVIGIELPNQTREMVYLREILSSDPFERAGGKLNLALGKDIGGLPVIVDLARMPHLLIAGTTGSGKSVGVNTMILSLLYQYPPEDCKFIMIDPKMLELSVYDGIPHLLSPVVTEPGKAVVALKWAVREMEERYRAMSQLGVRNIGGYNVRLGEARKKGEALTRKVQTGFDADGKPVFEEQGLSMDPLPYIVVVVDEMADLMMVAGKDIEAAVQRLAQMARAAGIHMIMATQRPSVDVITGTIKANFPTRISFQVTSKIDSRTILGEQGAEQLLGQGDMLYMAGGGRITRVHGPFVSDEEVEDIVSHLKSQANPDYIDAVTEDIEDTPMGGGGAGTSNADALYDEAVALVAREGKASTSFIQRHLQIGYNRAARIIEEMESQGVVTKANRVGRREVLIGDVSEYGT
ncbi:DNA translocase FtsK [Varunaivibrio sulfuroxidans]|nr:DNA translocase FtsK [Varunaivibrio sulfuroxidans]WES29861.1 DNA translocase FtsK 4TM domain-containing protein [Varunaivibrio sulfuroxidans]